jgi:hypothetical protein
VVLRESDGAGHLALSFNYEISTINRSWIETMNIEISTLRWRRLGRGANKIWFAKQGATIIPRSSTLIFSALLMFSGKLKRRFFAETNY